MPPAAIDCLAPCDAGAPVPPLPSGRPPGGLSADIQESEPGLGFCRRDRLVRASSKSLCRASSVQDSGMKRDAPSPLPARLCLGETRCDEHLAGEVPLTQYDCPRNDDHTLVVEMVEGDWWCVSCKRPLTALGGTCFSCTRCDLRLCAPCTLGKLVSVGDTHKAEQTQLTCLDIDDMGDSRSSLRTAEFTPPDGPGEGAHTVPLPSLLAQVREKESWSTG